jgi:hypothetical protein
MFGSTKVHENIQNVGLGNETLAKLTKVALKGSTSEMCPIYS